jgi:hypothetical protein
MAACLVPSGLLAQGEPRPLGSARIPRSVLANGQALPAGTYTLRLTTEMPAAAVGIPASASQWVEFVQGGQVRGRELATVVPADQVAQIAEGRMPGPGIVRVELLKNGEYLRVWANQGGTHYLVHLATGATTAAGR